MSNHDREVDKNVHKLATHIDWVNGQITMKRVEIIVNHKAQIAWETQFRNFHQAVKGVVAGLMNFVLKLALLGSRLRCFQ